MTSFSLFKHREKHDCCVSRDSIPIKMVLFPTILASEPPLLFLFVNGLSPTWNPGYGTFFLYPSCLFLRRFCLVTKLAPEVLDYIPPETPAQS